MRVKIKLKSKNVILPTNYKYFVQSSIYSNISDIPDFHNKGFEFENKTFKPFCFSDFWSENFKVENKKLFFGDEIEFVLTSPVDLIIKIFLGNILKNGLRLGNNFLEVSEMSEIKINTAQKILIKMLSPVTVYEYVKANGKNKTIYYKPTDKEFSEIIKHNLKSKMELLDMKDEYFNIIPKEVKLNDEKIIMYKDNYVVKAWRGIYEVEGSNNALNLVFDWGIGYKNSAGFGMVDII
ncbi:MAG TPA: CRISPR-associated endoribonuclease Cas6 [Tepiditoga sp.]|nr:CRISPR-associated endoribonuclease Cas6 [Tepiditoga sp.]